MYIGDIHELADFNGRLFFIVLGIAGIIYRIRDNINTREISIGILLIVVGILIILTFN